MQGRFEARKRKILEQLDAPDEEYHDLSPKGSVDKPIRTLISDINGLPGLVTTSSCSGRISVFLEGRKAEKNDTEPQDEVEGSRAGPGGKGGGGAWLFISHDPVDVSSSSSPDYMTQFGLTKPNNESKIGPDASFRFIHLKFEPMILHILTASLDHSQSILTAALSSGFRESGAVSLSAPKNGEINPMVAVRSTGYSFDSIIGFQNASGQNVAIVDEVYLRTLVEIANERFKINSERIARFRSSLLEHCSSVAPKNAKPDWEDPEARRRRKREEGLTRQRELQAQSL